MPLARLESDGLGLRVALESVLAVVCLYRDREDILASYCQSVGANLVRWVHQTTTWPPSYAVARSSDGAYTLWMSGTTNLSPQGLAHIQGTFARASRLGNHPVHGQWADAWDLVWADARTYLPDDLGGVSLDIAGHSYGGALAEYGALALARETALAVAGLGIGAPQSVTVGYQGPRPVVYSLASYGDPVYPLPASPYLIALIPVIAPLGWVSPWLSDWDRYADPVPLGPGGAFKNGEKVPSPLPPYVSTTPLGEHLPANYFGRLRSRWIALGEPEDSRAAILATEAAISGGSPPVLTPELPRIAVVSPGVTAPIPLYAGAAVMSPAEEAIPMSFPQALAGGTPYRVVRYVNHPEGGSSQSHLLYVTGGSGSTQDATRLASAKAAVSALNDAYRTAANDRSSIVGLRIGIDGLPGSAELKNVGSPGWNIGDGRVSAIPSLTHLGVQIRTSAGGGYGRGTLQIRGFSQVDVELSSAGSTARTKSLTARVEAMIQSWRNILIAGQNGVGNVPNVVGCVKLRISDEALNPWRIADSLSLDDQGRLVVTTEDRITFDSDFRRRLQLQTARESCIVGWAGDYRVVSEVAGVGTWSYTLAFKPQCGVSSVAEVEARVRPLRYQYSALAKVEGWVLATRDTGPAFFQGRGRRSGRRS